MHDRGVAAAACESLRNAELATHVRDLILKAGSVGIRIEGPHKSSIVTCSRASACASTEAFEQLRRRLALEFKLGEFLHEAFARARTATGLGERDAAAELTHRPGQRRRVSSFRREFPTQRSSPQLDGFHHDFVRRVIPLLQPPRLQRQPRLVKAGDQVLAFDLQILLLEFSEIVAQFVAGFASCSTMSLLLF